MKYNPSSQHHFKSFSLGWRVLVQLGKHPSPLLAGGIWGMPVRKHMRHELEESLTVEQHFEIPLNPSQNPAFQKCIFSHPHDQNLKTTGAELKLILPEAGHNSGETTRRVRILTGTLPSLDPQLWWPLDAESQPSNSGWFGILWSNYSLV